MGQKVFEYEIGGKVYVQRPLVLGQIRQIQPLLEGLELPRGVDVAGVARLLGDKLPEAFAVILTEKGKRPSDKDLNALASEMADSMEAMTAVQVIEDFFTCNPAASLLERLSGVMEKITGNLRNPKTG